MRQLAGILMSPLVSWLRMLGYGLDGEGFQFYPDGSLRWQGESDFSRTAFPRLQNSVPEGIGQAVYRPLAAFNDTPSVASVWIMTYPGPYATLLSKYDESGLGIAPQDGRPISADEMDAANVRVVVTSYSKLQKNWLIELAGTIGEWFDRSGRVL